jgi:hypothetical protein
MSASIDRPEAAPALALADRASVRIGLAILSVVALWAVGFALYSSNEPDDTHITYWEALSLSRYGAVLNYNGAPLETSSSLAHAALVAAAHRLTGAAIPTLGVLIPALFGGAAVLLGGALTLRIAPRFALVAAPLIATTPWLLYWVFGGLDAPIGAAALVAMVLSAGACVERPSGGRWVAFGAAVALLLTARPEGPLVAFATLIGAALAAIWRDRFVVRRAVLVPHLELLGIAGGETAALLAFRKVVFHVWMPNAVYAKAETIRVGDGVAYLLRHTGVCASWILLGVATALVVHLRGARRDDGAAGAGERGDATLDFALCACVATLAFVIASGGDWMFRGRFLVPLAPIAVPVALAAAERIAPPSFPPGAPERWVIFLLLPAFGLVLNVAASRELPGPTVVVDLRAHERRARELEAKFPRHDYSYFETSSKKHLREIYAHEALDDVIEALAALHRPVIVATRQAGFVPYHLAQDHFGAVHIVDTLNLATDDVRRCAPSLLHRLADVTDDPMNGFNYASGVAYAELLEKPEIFGPCGLTPDLIYDIGGPRVRLFADNDYRTVYEQIDRNSDKCQAFIAIKEELADAYHVETRRLRR